jgi:hypothetical protein
MSERHERDEIRQIRIHCPGCRGDGVTPVPTLAVLGGQGSTIVTARKCTQCNGSGRTRGIPPV